MVKRPQRRSSGLSLIETLTAVFVLGVGLTSVSALFIAGVISNTKAERTSLALNAAHQQMERLRSTGFSGAVADPEIWKASDGYTILQQNPDMTGQIGFGVPELPGAEGVIDIAYYVSASGYYPNLKQTTVTVTWAGGGVTGGQAVLQTLLANRP